MKSIELRQLFAEYNGDPHQLAAIDVLAESMPSDLLDKDSDWVVIYRAAPAPKAGRFVQ